MPQGLHSSCALRVPAASNPMRATPSNTLARFCIILSSEAIDLESARKQFHGCVCDSNVMPEALEVCSSISGAFRTSSIMRTQTCFQTDNALLFGWTIDKQCGKYPPELRHAGILNGLPLCRASGRSGVINPEFTPAISSGVISRAEESWNGLFKFAWPDL